MYTQTAYPVIDLAETGRSIERHRRQAGLTVRDLQTYFGFEYPQAIYKWQHGECLPTVDNLLALARLLRVPMEDLLVYDSREVSHFAGIPLSFQRPLFCRVKMSDELISVSKEEQRVTVINRSGNWLPLPLYMISNIARSISDAIFRFDFSLDLPPFGEIK